MSPITPRPARMAVLHDNIPERLKLFDRWVCWRYVWRTDRDGTGGAWTKMPIAARGGSGSSTDADTWSTYIDAVRFNGYGGPWKHDIDPDRLADGLGYVFSKTDGIVGIDLDKCVSPDGTIAPWAADIMRIAASYAEVSPSGTGVKVWVLGNLPGSGRNGTLEPLDDAPATPDNSGHVEIYDTGRYFTVTGHRLDAPAGEPAWSREPVHSPWLVGDLIRRLNASAHKRHLASLPPPHALVPNPTLEERQAAEDTRIAEAVAAGDPVRVGRRAGKEAGIGAITAWGLPAECDASASDGGVPEDPSMYGDDSSDTDAPPAATTQGSRPPPAGCPGGITWADLSTEHRRLVHQACRANAGFRRLWHGDLRMYASAARPQGDPSAADFTFCLHLLWWTGRDRPSADRLFRASSLMRDKWDDRRGDGTYGSRTLDECMRRTDPSLTAAERAPAPAPETEAAPAPEAEAAPAPEAEAAPAPEAEAIPDDALRFDEHERGLAAAARTGRSGPPIPARRDDGRSNDAAAPAQDVRPEIPASLELHAAADAALAALADGPARDHGLFHRGGALVHIINDPPHLRGTPDEQPSVPRIGTVPLPNLTERLAACALWTALDKGGKKRICRPPQDVAAAILTRGQWPTLRPLEAVCNAPVLFADGRLLSKAGYDYDTGLFITDEAALLADTMPVGMTKDESVEAIGEAISDFPFADETHRSSWYAYLLTMVGRTAFSGNSPLFLIDANTAGTGKGLLADAASIIATGRHAAKMSYQADDDDEMRKRITSLLMAGIPNVVLDNIVGRLGNPSLDLALTTDVWQDRMLGTNNTITMPMRIVWGATGNNLSIQADTARRICHCRLESQVEHPEERSGWRHPELGGWILAHRPRLLGAAISLLKGYTDAGMPDQALPAWGGFDGWSRLVRGTIVWAGLPDPRETAQELKRTSDMPTLALAQFIERLADTYPPGTTFTAAGILELVGPESGHTGGGWLEHTEAATSPLRNALLEFCSGRYGGLPTTRNLGCALRAARRRIVSVTITRAGEEMATTLMLDGGDKTKAGMSWKLV